VTLRWLQSKLEGLATSLYAGHLDETERKRVLGTFRARAGPAALLISLKAGGVGLNIQEASTVVLFDRWWNPATEDQAVQRAHRFGRDRPLHVIRLITKETVEERIAELLARKQALIRNYVGEADSSGIGPLSDDELRRILQLESAPSSIGKSRNN